MNINKEFISRNNINGTGNPCTYIVVHETDNWNRGANARAHAKSQYNGNFSDMSVHYYCGSDGIYQAAEHTCKCWHIGRQYVNSPNNPDCNNNNSIGIEICVNSDGNYTIARNNAIELVKYLIGTTGIPASRVIRHYDAKGKYCPRNMLDNPSLWTDFKNRIQGNTPQKPVESPEGGNSWKAIGTATATENNVNFRPRPTTNCTPYGQLGKGNRFEIDGQKKNGWVHAKVREQICWIYGDYIKIDGASQPASKPAPTASGWKAIGTATCTDNGVNIRSSAKMENNVIGRLNKGNRFEVDGQKSGEWVHVKVAGIGVGYIHRDRVKYD